MRAQRYVHRPAIRGSWSPVVPPLPLRRCFLLALGYLYLQRCSAGSMSASPGLQALQHDAYTAVCRAFYAQTALSWVSNLTPALSCVMPWAGRTGKRGSAPPTSVFSPRYRGLVNSLGWCDPENIGPPPHCLAPARLPSCFGSGGAGGAADTSTCILRYWLPHCALIACFLVNSSFAGAGGCADKAAGLLEH